MNRKLAVWTGQGKSLEWMGHCDRRERGGERQASPRLRVVPAGHHEVGPVGAALRAAKPQLGQRRVTAPVSTIARKSASAWWRHELQNTSTRT
jgi:hypothetical protein